MANRFQPFIDRLSSQTGLDKSVVAAWVKMEQGVNNNVLGITSASAKTPSNTHGLLKFSSQSAAADATAALLKRSSNYRGIVASFGQSPSAQAEAIARSPWHLGGAGTKAAGGASPYYWKGFVSAGLLSSDDKPVKPGGGASTPTTTVWQDVSKTAKENADSAPLGLDIDLSSPFFFIGIIIVGAVLILSGALVTLKGKAPTV